MLVAGRLVACFIVALAVVATGRTADLFPDKNLEAAVREQVFAKREKKEPLVEADVQNISVVRGKGKKIKNLAGLEKCVALAELDLENNEISDITPIKDLTNIQLLDLAKNKISNIGPIAGLVNLQYIQLSDNQISDLSPLAKLANMRSLYLDRNQIKDLGPVSHLSKLWSLYVRDNQISDLRPLASLKWLERLDVRGNQVADLSPLAGLTEWRYLIADKNKITDLAVLIEMCKKDIADPKNTRFAPFWNIYLHGNPLSDDAKTKQLEELKKLVRTVSLDETK
jgi:Leucine-rich repeat (LRR) protein